MDQESASSGDPGELQPLLAGEQAGASEAVPNFGTASDNNNLESKSHNDPNARGNLGKDEYSKRRNSFTSTLLASEPLVTLRERKQLYEQSKDKQKRKGCLEGLQTWFNAQRDLNPILRKTINDININFGSGIASLFYDWRWLILLNLLIWIIWLVFAIIPWFYNPPRFDDSDPPFAYFWDRKDLSFSSMLTGSATGKDGLNNTVVQDSFMFYTGYTDKMGTSDEDSAYPMGPAWVACIIATVVLLFANINGRLIIALQQRQHDPDVEAIIESRGFDSSDHKVGNAAQEALFAGFDHAAYTEEGMKGAMKALLTSWETLLAHHYKSYGVAAQLQMGDELYEIRCKIPGRKDAAGEELPSILQYQQKIKGDSSLDVDVDDCIVEKHVYRRKLEAGRACELMTDESKLQLALDEYVKANPDASKVVNDSSLAKVAEDLPGVPGTLNRVRSKVTKCILAYGQLWRKPHAVEQTSRVDRGEWRPTNSWLDAAKLHTGQDRPAVVFSIAHGEAQSATDYLKQAVGCFLTFILFIISGTGVYIVTQYSAKVAEIGGPYAVTVSLVLIQNVIPVVVKMLVLWEGWTSEEVVLNWTLGRVYVLKMANLVVLLAQLDKLGKKEDHCATLEVGLYLYQLVITGSIASMISNWATMYGTYRFAGKTGADRMEYDNQTVAQMYIELNYNTALVWIGYAYSPMLPLVAVLLGILEITWLARCLKWFCKCAEKPFQTTVTTKMLVMMIFFCTFAYSCIPTCLFLYTHPSVLYSLRGGKPFATYCGPIIATDRRYQVLVDFLLDWWPTLKDGLAYATNPVVLFGLIAVLCVLVAFNREAAKQVKEECANTYMDRVNAEAHLRERRIMHRVLEREKAAMDEEITSLKQQVADLEEGSSSLSKKLSDATRGWFGKGDGQEKKEKSTSCFG